MVKYVLNRIKNAIEAQHVKQKDLARKCNVTPSTLSKVLRGDSSLTLELAFSLCKALNLDPSDLFSKSASTLDDIATFQSDLIKRTSEKDDPHQDSLLFDADRRAFKGILNNSADKNDFYYVYLKPTISNEKNSILKGKLRLTASDTHPNICKASFELDTGKKFRDNTAVIKTYTGQMIISLPMGSCYIILTSTKYAEISMIVFKHMFLNANPLQCRIAAVITVSAGANRRPVMEKAIISRTNIDNHISDLEGQLFMNNSIIHLREDLFEKVSLDIQSSIFNESDENIDKKMNHLRDLMGNTITYYNMDEGKIRASTEFSASEKRNLINFLRKQTETPRYCKISSRADEYLYEFLEEEYGI